MSLVPALWPLATRIDRHGRLVIGSTDLVALAERWGTPLYVYDAATVRGAYRAYRAAFRGAGSVRVSYAMKACGLVGVAGLLARDGREARDVRP